MEDSVADAVGDSGVVFVEFLTRSKRFLFFPFQNGKYANEFEKVELTVYGSWKIVKFRLTLKKSGTR